MMAIIIVLLQRCPISTRNCCSSHSCRLVGRRLGGVRLLVVMLLGVVVVAVAATATAVAAALVVVVKVRVGLRVGPTSADCL